MSCMTYKFDMSSAHEEDKFCEKKYVHVIRTWAKANMHFYAQQRLFACQNH